MQSLLTGIEPTDPLALGVSIALVVTLAIASSALPALKASRIAPTEALRAE